MRRIVVNLLLAATFSLTSLISCFYIIMQPATPQNIGPQVAGLAIGVVALVASGYWTTGAVRMLLNMLQESRNETPS